EQLAALEISRLLRLPTASDIDTFVGGRLEMISFRLKEGDDLIGKTVSKIFFKSKIQVLMAAIQRGDEAIIPNGDVVLKNDDLISILGKPSSISDFLRQIGAKMEKVKDTMIIGGGKVTHYLADMISRQNIKVKIIEIDAKKCEYLSETLPNCLIIQGDGTDEEVLMSEDIKEVNSVVCLTDRDEENVVVGMYAMQCGVPKTIVKINHINLNLVKNIGLGSIVCPKNSTAYQIIKYVRGMNNSVGSSEIKTLYKIIDTEKGNIEALEFDVKATSRCIETPLKDLRIKKDFLIGCIVRNGNIIIPTGTAVIKSGDSVIVIAQNANINELDNILSSEFAMFGGE
ncbi:MAG: Trk system potassium transporter TrkA, partial [Clostridiales bacterium]|nr:Trk system potassium transporter TrkA [Clostridiales bacterium]